MVTESVFKSNSCFQMVLFSWYCVCYVTRKCLCLTIIIKFYQSIKCESLYFQNNACSRPSTVSQVEQRIPSLFQTRNVLTPTVKKVNRQSFLILEHQTCKLLKILFTTKLRILTHKKSLTSVHRKESFFMAEMLTLNEKAKRLLFCKVPLLTEEIMKGSLTCLWMNSTDNKELTIPTPAYSRHLVIPLCSRPDSLSKKNVMII